MASTLIQPLIETLTSRFGFGPDDIAPPTVRQRLEVQTAMRTKSSASSGPT
jgi:hypothetical protein